MPGNAHLSSVQRDELAAALLARLDILKRHEMAARAPGQGQALDEDEAAQRTSDDEVEAKRADMDNLEIDAVSAALHRIHGIGYGICADCGKPIPFVRLHVEPQATRCVVCEALQEQNS